MNPNTQTLLTDFGTELPLIGGAMYPCSNPELVAAVSAAGGLGVVQPMSLSFVHKHDFREGLQLIRSTTPKPIGLNLILETSSRTYQERTKTWANIAAEEGVKVFVTALGNPAWVVKLAEEHGIKVYHDVTGKKHAQKAFDAGVNGFIGVNNQAGGHAGQQTPENLLRELSHFGLPVVCAGGLGSGQQIKAAIDMGYAGAQLGTRFIASKECTAHNDYKQAIVNAGADDIVMTERLTGVPVAIINTPTIQRIGTKAGPIASWMLRGRKTKHYMRTIYSLQSIWKLKKASVGGSAYQDYWQAGKSAGAIHEVLPVAEIVDDVRQALR